MKKEQDLEYLREQVELSTEICQASHACKWLCQFTNYVYDPLVRGGKKRDKRDLPSCANRIDAENPGIIKREFSFFARRKSTCYQGFDTFALHILTQIFEHLDTNAHLNARVVCKRWREASGDSFKEDMEEYQLHESILSAMPSKAQPNPWLKESSQFSAPPMQDVARRKSIDKLLGDFHKVEKSTVQILVLCKNVDYPSIPFKLFPGTYEEERVKPGTCAFRQVERMFCDMKFRFIVMATDPNEEINTKLLPVFQDVTSIVFFVPSARYDQITPHGDNILMDSAEYLQRISHSQYMRKVPIILFFTQSDLFAEKVNRVDLRTVFPQFTPGADAKSFVQTLFCERAHVDSYCYLCWTGQTNDEQEFLFLATRDIVLRNAFMNHGILA